MLAVLFGLHYTAQLYLSGEFESEDYETMEEEMYSKTTTPSHTQEPLPANFFDKDYPYPKKGFMELETLKHIVSNDLLSPRVNPCPVQSNSSHLNFLVLVKTTPINSKQRDLIRKNVPENVTPIFLLGKDSYGNILPRVSQEFSRFGDVLIGNFIESYRNLTVKTLMGITYAINHCHENDIVLVMDGDHFVNFVGFTELVKKRYPSQELFLSCGGYDPNVGRDPRSRHYVTRRVLSRQVARVLSGSFLVHERKDFKPDSFWPETQRSSLSLLAG